jgi:hypothetical protein
MKAAIVFLLIVCALAYAMGEPAPPNTSGTDIVPIDLPHEAHLLELDRRAIEDAYMDQIKHLFQVWMKDDKGQPQRALVGARQARKAYIGSMEGIEKRERELKEMQGKPK